MLRSLWAQARAVLPDVASVGDDGHRPRAAIPFAQIMPHPQGIDEALLRVRVTPRAGRDALAGWQDGVLHVRLAAPPVEGRANAALVRFLASALRIPSRDVRLVAGERAREKRLLITGISEAEVRTRLGAPS
jgi:uncharacterized protein (TIGR00251 family)